MKKILLLCFAALLMTCCSEDPTPRQIDYILKWKCYDYCNITINAREMQMVSSALIFFSCYEGDKIAITAESHEYNSYCSDIMIINITDTLSENNGTVYSTTDSIVNYSFTAKY